MRIDDDGLRRRLSLAREMLEALDETPSIRAIAKASGISPAHFIRVFERTFGETPHQFRIAARLRFARSLLAHSDRTVTEVCMELGFSSLGSFSALFARRVGEAPSLYARRMRPIVTVHRALQRPHHSGCYGLMGLLPANAFRTFREA